MDFVDRAYQAKKPFFLCYNATRMHVWTRLKKEAIGRTGIGIYPDGPCRWAGASANSSGSAEGARH